MRTFFLSFVLSVLLFFVSCNNGCKTPSVANINISVNITEFNKILFALDTNNIAAAVAKLQKEHGVVFKDYATFVCRSNIADTAKLNMDMYAHLSGDRVIYDSAINPYLPNISFLKNNVEQALKYQKYYFPNANMRTEIYTYYFDPIANNGTNFKGITLGEKSVGFGMQFYMGSNFSWYADKEFADIAPTYRSLRFSTAYMVSDMVQKTIENELYKPAKGKNNLIDQIIERGKQWYIKKKLLPTAPDSIITGFTQYQLAGCKNQEGLIWKTVLTQDANSNDPETIRGFLGEAPYSTATGNVESPGNIGQWIGLQIVEAFAANYNTLSLNAILKTDSQDILDKAKYRPK